MMLQYKRVQALFMLLLLAGCEPSPTQSDSPAPQSSPDGAPQASAPAPAPAVSSAPGFHRRYTTASADYTFSRTGYQQLQLDNGEILLLGHSLMTPRNGSEAGEATPPASIERDEDYQVTVSEAAPAPVSLAAPTVMPPPEIPAIEVSLRSGRSECTGS